MVQLKQYGTVGGSVDTVRLEHASSSVSTKPGGVRLESAQCNWKSVHASSSVSTKPGGEPGTGTARRLLL